LRGLRLNQKMTLS